MAPEPTVIPVKSVNHIHRRVGHITVAYNDEIIVWGGFTASGIYKENNAYCPTTSLWLFNCHTEIWTEAPTIGEIPFRNSGGTGLVYDDHLYLFGGIPNPVHYTPCYSNQLFRLNLKTYVWEHLKPLGVPPLGTDKGVGWVYEDRLYFFGGYGELPNSMDNNDIYHQYVGVLDGWNNLLSCYDPDTNSWISLKVSGTPPGPRAAHAADISGDFVFIFGGRLRDERNNDLFALDMKKLEWKHNLTTNSGSQQPSGRSWHSFNFVSPNHAIIYGGLRNHGFPSRYWWDCYITPDLKVRWKRVKMKYPLIWHKAAFMPSTGELIVVGGVIESPYTMTSHDHVLRLLVLRLQPLSLFRLCLNTILTTVTLSKLNGPVPRSVHEILLRREIQSYESFLEANPPKPWLKSKETATRPLSPP